MSEMNKEWFESLCKGLACCNGLASYDEKIDPIEAKPTDEQKKYLGRVAQLCKIFLSFYEKHQ